MRKKPDPEIFLANLEHLEANAASDHAFFEEVISCADDALSRSDADSFLGLCRFFENREQLTTVARFSSLLQLRYLIGAVENERKLQYPLFIRGVRSFRALEEKATRVTHMLRRIEFDIDQAPGGAYAYIRENDISQYAVSALLYGTTSKLGHREQLLLKLSGDALSHMRLMEAFGFLSVIENPSDEAVALRTELEEALKGGET